MAKRKKRFMTPKAARRRTRKLKSQIAERRKKEFTYRGLTLEELQALPLFPPESNPINGINFQGLMNLHSSLNQDEDRFQIPLGPFPSAEKRQSPFPKTESR